MSSDLARVRKQTLIVRKKIAGLLTKMEGQELVIPQDWNNHAMWHAGHLTLTPRLLTRGLRGEELGRPAEWRGIFGKGSSPKDWSGQIVEGLPDYGELISEIPKITEELFEEFEDKADEPFSKPYETSAGVTLHNPADALTFSYFHDGIHLGLLLALKRSLD